MIEASRDGVRRLMVEAMSGYSEENYAAGWENGLGDIIRHMANDKHPEWMVLAYLAEGWPEMKKESSSHQGCCVELWQDMDWEPLSIFEETTAREFIVRSATRPPRDSKPQRTDY